MAKETRRFSLGEVTPSGHMFARVPGIVSIESVAFEDPLGVVGPVEIVDYSLAPMTGRHGLEYLVGIMVGTAEAREGGGIELLVTGEWSDGLSDAG